MTVFRPCIDLLGNQVVQIVGSSLGNDLKVNHSSAHSSCYYAQLYKDNHLSGGHVIKLDNSDEQAIAAIQTCKLQLGGGITLQNALNWLDLGADKLIVTSWLFPNQQLDWSRLRQISELIGTRNLVVDLSCKRASDSWIVAMNKWQVLTDAAISEELLHDISQYCSEFLIHAAHVEGKCQGIDEELVTALGKWSKIPCTYAGGANSVYDLNLVNELSLGRVDLTFGSSLDIFGGLVKFKDLVDWNNAKRRLKSV